MSPEESTPGLSARQVAAPVRALDGRPATGAGGRREAALQLIRIGLLWGLAYGFIEAGSSLVLSHIPGGLSWDNGTAPPVLLVAPVFYALAYLAVALILVLPATIRPRFPWDIPLTAVLALISALMLSRLQRNLLSPLAALILAAGVTAVVLRSYLRRRDLWIRRMRRALPSLGGAVLVIGALGGFLLPPLMERLALARLGPVRGNGKNVLLIVLDTERADHLSAYGYARPTTPRLDSLARAGALFQEAFAGAPTTLPSHATLMTGLPVHVHRAGTPHHAFLDGRYPTIAEVLRDHGYRTGGFVGNVFFTGRISGLARGFLHYEDYFGRFGDVVSRTELGRRMAYWALPRMGFPDIPGRKNAALVNREFLDWVGQGRERPFFAFLNYMDQHAPYLPPPPYRGRFGPEAKVPEWHPRRVEIGAWDENAAPPDSAVLALWRQRYDESLSYLDDQIGGLLDSLRGRGLLQNTVVIITSDHGEAFGEHQMIHHGGGLYPEQIRVPLIVWRADAPWAGTTVPAPVSLAAVPEAIMQWTGIRDVSFPGAGIRAALVEPGMPTDPVLLEAPFLAGNPETWPTGQGMVWSLVSRNAWQVIQLESGATELYDLRSDPGAHHDLDTLPSQDARFQRLLQRLRSLSQSAAGSPSLQAGISLTALPLR